MAANKLNVKKGDNVIVIAGKDKGKQGKVLSTSPKNEKVVVEGVATVKRHTKPSQKLPQGGVVFITLRDRSGIILPD